VWSDTFGSEKQKTIFLTLLLLASPLGVVLGYSITFYCIQHYKWEYSFYLQSLSLIPCAIAFLLIPRQFIDVEHAQMVRLHCSSIVHTRSTKV
jgi:dipeptide/tripeptide permease